MGISFNADEIFEMAEEIERNGAKFYHQAAEKAGDANIKTMFRNMASMEESHLLVFEEMRTHLSDEEKGTTTFDPDDQAVMYLQTMADMHGVEGKKSLTEQLSGNESIAEILDIALAAEKESVVFYSGLKNYVTAHAGRDKVDAIIKEELSHIATINQKRKEMGC